MAFRRRRRTVRRPSIPAVGSPRNNRPELLVELVAVAVRAPCISACNFLTPEPGLAQLQRIAIIVMHSLDAGQASEPAE